jgi:DNA-binding NarL/FixJ family response regulator
VNATRILLVDDHTLVRAGIRSLLEGLDGVREVVEAGDGRAALELIRIQPPDIVLMDIAMKGLNGVETTRLIKKEFPKIFVIILSMHSSEEYVLHALQAGASGYLMKDAAPVELELALVSVLQGNTYLSPLVSRQVITDYLLRIGEDKSDLLLLTPRQREILQLISEGMSTKEIANLLQISVKTVETHRQQIMDRLNIHNIPGLVRFAVREGLVTVE